MNQNPIKTDEDLFDYIQNPINKDEVYKLSIANVFAKLHAILQFIVRNYTYCSSRLSGFLTISSAEDSYGTILELAPDSIVVIVVSAVTVDVDGEGTGELYGVLVVSAFMRDGDGDGELTGELSLGNRTPSDSSSSVADFPSSESLAKKLSHP